jgi:hypothetical protein
MNRRNFFQLMWGVFAITVFGNKRLWSETRPSQVNDETRQYSECTEVQTHENSRGWVQTHEDHRPCALKVTTVRGKLREVGVSD